MKDLRTEKQIRRKLLSLSGSQALEDLRDFSRRPLDSQLVRLLRDKVGLVASVDIRMALKLGEIAYRVSALVGDPSCIALGLRAKGQALWMADKYAQALRLYERAERIYRRLSDELETAKVIRSKVALLNLLGRYEKALAEAESARRIFERYGEKALLAELETNVGNIYHRQDQYQRALDCYERARQIFSSLGDNRALAIVEYDIANVLTFLNRLDEALELYRSARDLFEREGLRIRAANTDYGIAYLYFIKREYNEALKLLSRVKELYREVGTEVDLALCDLDTLEVYLELNLFEDVLALSEDVERRFKSLSMRYETAKARTYRALAKIHLGRFQEAAQELERAGRDFASEGNDVYCGLTTLYLADLKIKTRDFAGAYKLAEKAHAVFVRENLPIKAGYAKLQMARSKWYLGDLQSAKILCRQALDAVAGAEAPWLSYQCYHLLGNITVNEDYEQGYGYFAKAIEQIELLRSNIQPDEFKTAFLKDKLRVYEDMILLCLERKRCGEEAFNYVERARSRALADLLLRGQAVEAKLSSQIDSTLLRRWDKLRAELNYFYDKANKIELGGHRRSVGVEDRYREEIRAREKELSELLREIQLYDEEYASLESFTVPDAGTIRSCLKDKEAILEYFFVKDELKVFALDERDISAFSTGVTRQQIASLIQALRFQLNKFLYSSRHARNIAAIRNSANHILHKLYGLLIAPVADSISGKDLVVVPVDQLHYVPFEALYDGSRYLIEGHAISYAPSAYVFKLCQDKKLETNGKALILGIPDKQTPHIAEEIEAIKRIFPNSKLLTNGRATKEALAGASESYKIIHIASHGLFRSDNPLFSALRLADSWLSFHDIYNLNLRAELVTLSGCYSGLNKIYHGDELIGLMRGFLYAGAASLVVSLWAVNDKSTAELMTVFYEKLKDGLEKRRALREAKMELKSRYDHPYFWAPFILVGKR